MMNKTSSTKVGLIGAGTISGIYLKNAAWLNGIEIDAIADIRRAAAESKAAEYNIPTVMSVNEMLASDTLDMILNLTTPDAHAPVGLAIVNAGKSVYAEKPLTLTMAEGRALIDAARANGVRIGSAPDTFLGAAHQTCRQLIDEGAIGRPIGATAFMMSYGMEMWHPNPAFYFKAGGGPMFDMGPYYLTALINLLGPVTRVSGMVTQGRKQRTITSKPLAGTLIDVEVPTHVTGTLQFANGAIGTLIMSFDIAGSRLPHIEIYGTEGTLAVSDPNRFGDPIYLKRPGGNNDWEPVPLTRAYRDNSRGLGLAEMAHSMRMGEPHRTNGDMAYHVLELMWALHDSAETNQHITIQSTCQRPAPMPTDAFLGTPPSGEIQ
jgi:predicted dehydrogenase